jgi:hypothetical protein
MSQSDAAETAVVTLRLDRGAETISGTLEDEGGLERPFWGWLELSAALDRSRSIDHAPPEQRASRKPIS